MERSRAGGLEGFLEQVAEVTNRAYFTAEDAPDLAAAVRCYGFLLIMLPLRNYAALLVPDPNRPESWVLEAVRRQLEQFGVGTSDTELY